MVNTEIVDQSLQLDDIAFSSNENNLIDLVAGLGDKDDDKANKEKNEQGKEKTKLWSFTINLTDDYKTKYGVNAINILGVNIRKERSDLAIIDLDKIKAIWDKNKNTHEEKIKAVGDIVKFMYRNDFVTENKMSTLRIAICTKLGFESSLPIKSVNSSLKCN